jgi:hypothetical protein
MLLHPSVTDVRDDSSMSSIIFIGMCLVFILSIFLDVACVWEGRQADWTLTDWTAAKCVVEMTPVSAVIMSWGAARCLMPVGLVWVWMMACVTVSVWKSMRT